MKLVQDHYPELEELYQSYPNPVQRADFGRYLVLDHCGGIYADIDTECVSTVEPLAQDTRVVLALEPLEHFHHALTLGMDKLIFNGVMASPKGHPFWKHMIARLVQSRHARRHVLESTGPLVLTAAVETFADPSGICVSSCHIFNPLAVSGRWTMAPEQGDYAGHKFCNHYWNNSWFGQPKGHFIKRLKRRYRKFIYNRTRGAYLTKADAAKRINTSTLYQSISDHDKTVAVLIPVRDAEPFLERCFALLLALNYPKDRLKLVFCEGDSVDGTVAKLTELAQANRAEFASIEVLQCQTKAALERGERWSPKLQKTRRANLAKVRNHLVEHGMTDQDHWALWLDVDVCDFDPDILNRLMSEREKVVTPDCVHEWGEESYDMNAFVEDTSIKDYQFYKHVKDGLYMPPSNSDRRRHLSGLRCLDRVPLNSVGGTMLLVHGSVHRSGIWFPETPYDHLLETEGFGRMCLDFGVTPIGLPNLQIRHVRT